MKAIKPNASAMRLKDACLVSDAINSPRSNKVRMIGSDKRTKPIIEGTPINKTNLIDQSIVLENPSLSSV